MVNPIVVPEKYDEIREAVIFEELDKACDILHNYVDNGTLVDFAVIPDNGNGIADAAIKFDEGGQFWLVTSGKPWETSA